MLINLVVNCKLRYIRNLIITLILNTKQKMEDTARSLQIILSRTIQINQKKKEILPTYVVFIIQYREGDTIRTSYKGFNMENVLNVCCASFKSIQSNN